MTDERVLNPGYYHLKSLVIQSIVGDPRGEMGVNAIEIGNIVPAITINTSIESDVLNGAFTVIDGVGVLEKFPLRGEERAKISLEDSMQNEIEFDVVCYKISDMSVSDENGVVAYTVHFVSYQSFVAGKHSIIRAFKEKTVSDIIETMFSEYYVSSRPSLPIDLNGAPGTEVLDGNKGIIIYPSTEGTIRCTIPKMKPGQAINFLSKRAYSSSSPSCSFRFFENSRSYYFISDEMLFDVAEGRNKKFYFTFYDSIPKIPSNFNLLMHNLESFSNTRRVNSIEDMYSGAYRNKVIVLDILNAEANLIEPGYSYMQNRGSYFDVRNEQVSDRHTSAFINEYANEEIQKTFIVVKDFMSDAGNDNASMSGYTYFPDIISNRLAYRKHLDSINVQAIGPGRFDVSAGDIINLEIPELNSMKESIETNKQLSGDYIVKSVSHIMNNEVIKNHYTLIKKEWSEVSMIANTNNNNSNTEGNTV